MASHTFHPPVLEHGLADGCDRCTELAANPLHLDPPNFALAWERMLRTQYMHLFPGERVPGYRTETEAALGSVLYTWSVFAERFHLIRDQLGFLDHLRTMAVAA